MDLNDSSRSPPGSGRDLARAVRRRLRDALCVLCVGALASAASPWVGGAETAARPRPNIIVVMTDDQTLAALDEQTMPRTLGLIGDRGTAFTDYVVATPLCCPSRATLLTGQYPHNNGVLSGNPGYGSLLDPGDTLPVWLRRAGYRTIHVGRYLNRYADAVGDPNRAPPGWSEWVTLLEPRSYYGYDLHVNGRTVSYGSRDRDYVTTVLDERAASLVRRYAPRSKPFYLQLDEIAPHVGPAQRISRCDRAAAVPGPRDESAFVNKPLPMPPSFNEEDVSDKPSFIRDLPSLDASDVRGIRYRYRCALASLLEVDRGVNEIAGVLRNAHELRDTAFIFSSDNGYYYGEHRIAKGKVEPYEEAIHLPLLIRLPRASYPHAAGRVPRSRALVANVDLAPTILHLANAAPCRSPADCRTLDGHSLVPLLRGKEPAWTTGRGILLEYRSSAPRARRADVCAYTGVRTARQVYVDYRSAPDPQTRLCQPINEREHYDLRGDPFELDNLWIGPPGTPREQRLAQEATELRDCAGIAGRDPLPPSGHYCN